MSEIKDQRQREEETQTIQSLFAGATLYKIPSYQRAYSWGKQQRKQFIEDLNDQPEGTPYYYGHFIFEEGDEPNTTYIIDGQQRLTTFILFLSCARREIEGRSAEEREQIASKALSERYLNNRLETVDSDQNLFLELIKRGQSSDRTESRSKTRLRETVRFFSRLLRGTEIGVLADLINKLETAEITTFLVHSKVQATQIFTLQNSRGKELTSLEKLKAFLMFEIYLNAPAGAKNSAIRQVERSFAEIYREIEHINLLDEDGVLRNYDYAYSELWDTPLNNQKKSFSQLPEGQARVDAITQYAQALASSFNHVRQLERIIQDEDLVADLIILDAGNTWPLLIKLYAYYGDEITTNDRLKTLLRNIEIVLLKFNFQHGRSSNDLIGLTKRLNDTEERLIELCDRMEQCVHKSFRWRSDFDERVLNYLEGKYHYDRTSRYFLWKYENDLRDPDDVKISPREFINTISRRKMDSTTEHIAPRNPEGITYSDDFANNWVDNLGNLLFMPRGMNSSLSNKLPVEKATRLDTSYASHREVKATIDTAGRWTEVEIVERKDKIIKFIKERWQLEDTRKEGHS